MRDRIPTAVRAFIQRVTPTKKDQGSGSPYQPSPRWPATWIIFDAETRVDAGQALIFAPYALGDWSEDGTARVLQEGIVYRDDLADSSPSEFAALGQYLATHRADVCAEARDRALHVYPVTRFMYEVFRPEALQTRSLVVNFNLPFDLTRVAFDVGEGRGAHAEAYSCTMFSWLDKRTGERRPNRYQPRLILKCDGRTRAFIKFAVPDAYDAPQSEKVRSSDGATLKRPFQGRFLDLKTLAHALTGKVHSLSSACEAFKTPEQKAVAPEMGHLTNEAIDYARQDVRAARSLMEALRREFDTHPVDLAPDKAFSPASIAKAYLRALGVARPMRQFATLPETLHGAAMVSYYGGRAECRIRKVPVPVIHTDFVSEYPTAGANLGIWDLLTAETITYDDVTEEVRATMEALTVDRCLNRDFWKTLCWFAEIQPDGDVLPVRAKYGTPTQGFSIGDNPLTTSHTTWYAGPDLIASWIKTGRVPKIVQAFRMVPHGKQPSLRPITLADGITIDPTTGDLFKSLIELRKKVERDTTRSSEERGRIAQALKIFANSLYGVMAELNEEDPPPAEPVDVHVFGIQGGFNAQSPRPEILGEFHFPPAAALITAGGRLMLSILERLVTDRGGAYAFCDTDSMAIVATATGGLLPCPGGDHQNAKGIACIRALPRNEVESIVAEFATLNPYDPALVPGSVLAIKGVNLADGKFTQLYAYAISAKRYCFARPQGHTGLEIIEPKEHGLGHLLDPLGPNGGMGSSGAPLWIEEVWRYIAGPAFGVAVEPPAFLHVPAVTQLSLTVPKLWRPFRDAQRDLPRDQRVGPCNFVCSAHVEKLGYLPGVDPTHFHLLKPFSRNPAAWEAGPWLDVYSGQWCEVIVKDLSRGDCAVLKTMADVIDEFAIHPEAKSNGPDGQPCGYLTIGLLQRRPIFGAIPVYLGKESKHADLVKDGVEHDLNRVQAIYVDPRTDPVVTVLLPALSQHSIASLRRNTGRSERQCRNYRSGRVRPPAAVLPALWKLVQDQASAPPKRTTQSRITKPRRKRSQ
jgi:hypothetical protein